MHGEIDSSFVKSSKHAVFCFNFKEEVKKTIKKKIGHSIYGNEKKNMVYFSIVSLMLKCSDPRLGGISSSLVEKNVHYLSCVPLYSNTYIDSILTTSHDVHSPIISTD